MPDRIVVAGVGAVSPAGFDARGLATAAAKRHLEPSRDLRASHGEVAAGQIRAIPPERDAGDRRAHKLMSRGARLAAVAARSSLDDAGWDVRDELGFFLGVGASAARMNELVAVLRASYEEGELSMARLGAKGLRAFNPLRTFMLLPNFTMCHSALLEGITGPNGTYFSRGTGTVAALMEAAHAIESGDCARALCGGADSALHPLLWAELVRDGLVDEGLVPGEGAAVIALQGSNDDLDAIELVTAAIHPARRCSLSVAADRAVAAIEAPVDLCVIAPWGRAARAALNESVRVLSSSVPIVDLTDSLGDSLAATPALAWAVAIDHLRSHDGHVAVLSAGIDGDIGVTQFRRGANT